jgi:hypothetical protein
VHEWLCTEFGLVIGFIEQLQIVTISNRTAISNSQSAIHYSTKLNLLSLLWLHHFLVTASKGGRSSSSGFPNSPRPQLPASNSNSSQQLNPSGYLTNSLTNSSLTNLLITSRLGSHKKHHSSVAVQLLLSVPHSKHQFSTVVCGPLPSKGPICHSIYEHCTDQKLRCPIHLSGTESHAYEHSYKLTLTNLMI